MERFHQTETGQLATKELIDEMQAEHLTMVARLQGLGQLLKTFIPKPVNSDDEEENTGTRPTPRPMKVKKTMKKVMKACKRPASASTRTG